MKTLARPLAPTEAIPWLPDWKPNLRGYFFCRPHSTWGAAVCWHEWCNYPGAWGINWGIACKTMLEAKTLRKFLNSRVSRFGGPGVPFEQVVYTITSKRVRA